MVAFTGTGFGRVFQRVWISILSAGYTKMHYHNAQNNRGNDEPAIDHTLSFVVDALPQRFCCKKGKLANTTCYSGLLPTQFCQPVGIGFPVMVEGEQEGCFFIYTWMVEQE